jgi:hypothetical protein
VGTFCGDILWVLIIVSAVERLVLEMESCGFIKVAYFMNIGT